MGTAVMTNTAAEITPDYISRAADEIRKIKPDYRLMLDLYEKIFVEQEKSKAGIHLAKPLITDEALSAKLSKKLSLVDATQFVIDRGSSDALFRTLCDVLSDAGGDLSEPVKRISDAVTAGVLRTDDCFSAFIVEDESFFDSIEKEHAVDKQIVSFIVYNSLKPSLVVFSGMVSEYLDTGKEWDRGFCPVCGSMPTMSVFDENGKRSLICGYCEHRWVSKRVYCPFCENTDHETLHYFEIEDEEEYRVDVCDKCNGYIKTVDVKKTTRRVYLPFENVSTPYIDMKFEEMGYSLGCCSIEQ